MVRTPTRWLPDMRTDVVGASEEVDHEAGLGQVRQDGVVHDHQHLLVEADGQLGEEQVRCSLTPRPRPRPPRPLPLQALPCA